MDKKFEREEKEKPLTDYGKTTKKNERPSIDDKTIRNKKSNEE